VLLGNAKAGKTISVIKVSGAHFVGRVLQIAAYEFLAIGSAHHGLSYDRDDLIDQRAASYINPQGRLR
jgi:hypothetical protein